ncbi:MAG: isoprenylcysteine carboxylmethyltransferase family protein [Rhodocyclales bacterium]|nr:isoprenylcysteine carboxylmethyltransferase family protein [Rhodocyclales bacterium]
MNALELRIPPLVLLLVYAAAMWLAATWQPALAFVLPWRVALAAALAAAGVACVLAGGAQFRKAATTVNPTRPGTASSMVTTGIYRHSRNPMYLGMLLALAAWAIFLAHPLAFPFLPAFVAYMNRFQIGPEERALAAKFGAGFAAYRQTVRRWL